jgi:hypothetical protein
MAGQGGGFLIEIIRMGAYARVTAMDPITLTEVVAMGAASASDLALRQLAARKLEAQLRKKGLWRD